jgi:hypothetical protein
MLINTNRAKAMSKREKGVPDSGSNTKWMKAEALLQQPPAHDAVLVFCMTQNIGPLQALAIPNHALQGYSVTHALVRLIYDEHLLPVFNVGVWHEDQGFELQSIVTVLWKLVGQEWELPGDNVLFPGSTMLVGPLDVKSETELQDQLSTGWMPHPEGDANPFELFTVSVPVTQDGLNLIHMYEIKAFRKKNSGKLPSFLVTFYSL